MHLFGGQMDTHKWKIHKWNQRPYVGKVDCDGQLTLISGVNYNYLSYSHS